MRLVQSILVFALSLSGLGSTAQCSESYLITASRTGLIEFLDPATLQTHSSLQVNVSPAGTGINGVFADPNGRTIYIEGPMGPASEGCCWLYSIDLGTRYAKAVADVWGSRSRRRFIGVGPGAIQPISDEAAALTEEGGDWKASPDGRWWSGLRGEAAVDLYNVARGKITQTFALPALEPAPDLPLQGAWRGTRFYVYAADVPVAGYGLFLREAQTT